MRFIFVSMLMLGLVMTATAGTSVAQMRQETIAAVVNNDAVTASDVASRLRLIMASSGMPDTPEFKERLTPQILNILIEERLKMQEAERLEITVPEDEIENGFRQIASQNNMALDEFRAILRQEQISPATMEEQIRAQIAWSLVVQQQLRPQIIVADNEVESRLARLKADIGKTEYLVSEIFLPVDEPREEANVRQLADRVTAQLVEGRVPFQRVATQFSQAAGAARGGDIGWVQQGQLADELDKALAGLDEGELSRPVRSLSGYHILYLRQKRNIAPENMPSVDDLHSQIGMERLDRLQRRYLLDLKAGAFIEQRV